VAVALRAPVPPYPCSKVAWGREGRRRGSTQRLATFCAWVGVSPLGAARDAGARCPSLGVPGTRSPQGEHARPRSESQLGGNPTVLGDALVERSLFRASPGVAVPALSGVLVSARRLCRLNLGRVHGGGAKPRTCQPHQLASCRGKARLIHWLLARARSRRQSPTVASAMATPPLCQRRRWYADMRS